MREREDEGKRVYLPYKPFSKGNLSQVIFSSLSASEIPKLFYIPAIFLNHILQDFRAFITNLQGTVRSYPYQRLVWITGDGPFFTAVQELIFNELPLNVTKSENLQMFCHGASWL